MDSNTSTLLRIALVGTFSAIAMLLYALCGSNAPYAFYLNMRLVIALATALDCIALLGEKSRRRWLCIPAIGLAFVHLTQHMPKQNWTAWNLGAFICFLSIAIALATPKREA
jgi:hypothetical protein